MKVFPVRYRWNDGSNDGTYYIVADSETQAEDIAYECIAANILPYPEANERPASDGRKVARVWVMRDWASETTSRRAGLLGTGSEEFNARAYTEYVRQTGRFS
jgi:hypothetical protein